MEPSRSKKSANNFRFGRVIGEGSFSTVYLAKEIDTNREYASEWDSLGIIERKICRVQKKKVFFFFFFIGNLRSA